MSQHVNTQVRRIFKEFQKRAIRTRQDKVGDVSDNGFPYQDLRKKPIESIDDFDIITMILVFLCVLCDYSVRSMVVLLQINLRCKSTVQVQRSLSIGSRSGTG